MYVYQVSDRKHEEYGDNNMLGFSHSAGREKTVVFADHIVVDSPGNCLLLNHISTSRTLWFKFDSLCDNLCYKCAKKALRIETVQVFDQSASLEIKSRNLVVTKTAHDFCKRRKISLVNLPASNNLVC